MAASSALTDISLITDLCEMLDRNPESIDLRKLLAEAYNACGWGEPAADEYANVLPLEPGNPVSSAWLQSYTSGTTTTPSPADNTISAVATSLSSKMPSVGFMGEANGDDLLQLGEGYSNLMSEARNILSDMNIIQELCPGITFDGEVADLRAIADGRPMAVIKTTPPPSARAIATRIKAEQSHAVELAFADLEFVLRWTRNHSDQVPADELRSTLLKRSQAVDAALPDGLKHVVAAAFMHVEHELLGKNYHNDGGLTMLGDEIAEIPRERFLVTEDGFAWDMAELTQALKANSGVMRNPLSKQMFTADDVRAIVRHPLGSTLAALQLQQKELSCGVRRVTIERLDRMAGVLLDDQSIDATRSREAVDEFLSFAATLPDAEQTALNTLRVPATDSHTGQPFDVTIGDAVADAKANRQCFHKTGDMLRQAAKYLRTNSKGRA